MRDLRSVLLFAAWLLLQATPTPAQPFVPPDDARDIMIDACRNAIEHDLARDAAAQGFGSGAEIVVDEDEVGFVAERPDRVRIAGRGDYRLAHPYLMQPMTFTCEWDPTRERMRRSTLRPARGASVTALPQDLAVAVDACKRQFDSTLDRIARMRSHWRPRIKVFPGVRFDDFDEATTFVARGTFKFDEVQEHEMLVDFRCVWDARLKRLSEARELTDLSGERVRGVVTCESRNMARRTCEAAIRGSVRIRRTLSDTRCREGVNWSHSRSEIVVWDGCRATFEFDLR